MLDFELDSWRRFGGFGKKLLFELPCVLQILTNLQIHLAEKNSMFHPGIDVFSIIHLN